MFKIKELMKDLIKTQNEINESLKRLYEIKIDSEAKIHSTYDTVNRMDNAITTNIYTKEETMNQINKELDYRQKFIECEKKNKNLLEMIEKYCKYKDKYEILDIFLKIDKEYIVEKAIE